MTTTFTRTQDMENNDLYVSYSDIEPINLQLRFELRPLRQPSFFRVFAPELQFTKKSEVGKLVLYGSA